MINIHILGESGHAGRKHREAIEQLPELYTITDYDDADIIDICTPNWLHSSNIACSLGGNKSCMVEKPFCSSLEELETLHQFENKFPGEIYPILNYRNLDFDNYSATWQRSPDYYAGWRGKLGTALGGVILSHGIHLIDHAICRLGGVTSVECKTWSDPRYVCEVETTAEICLHFVTGSSRILHLQISPDTPSCAPTNPGYADFFMNVYLKRTHGTSYQDVPRLYKLYHLQEVLDACYAAARSSSIIRLSSAALTA